ncbi:MAG: sugar phosphate isomerase/epimerase [Cytophagaceae bacterium]|nr:sugar phosphate isomerase/epimerase [Cytophagaceae bacterium]MBP6094167.1 sugar phosphate isomerase/epimerase [Cytophagaceae bacterium]
MLSRRRFLAQNSLLAFAAFLPTAKSKSFRMGYSAITWGGKDELAIEELSGLGFKGIQLRANTYAKYKDNPAEIKALLDSKGMSLVMFSSGNVEIDPAKKEANAAMHLNHARFVKALGGTSIQLTNSLRKNNIPPTADELARLAVAMNEIGALTKEIGIQATYHNHMNQYGETPEEVDALVKAMNPAYVRLLLDVAHYHQGGGKPVEAVLKYQKVLHSLHIKDVECPIKGDSNPKSYKFVELGQGNVDLLGVFAALDKIKFSGWAIVELDAVPDKAKLPVQCAQISKDFLQGRIAYQF